MCLWIRLSTHNESKASHSNLKPKKHAVNVVMLSMVVGV